MKFKDKLNWISDIFPQKREIYSLLDGYIFKDTSVFVCVSWWPDSMLLGVVLREYFIDHWRDLSTLTILHVNHKTRKETDQEEQFVKEYFHKCTVISFSYRWIKKTEKALREARRWFIESYIFKQKKVDVVVLTWHNLTDRIETTLLHMIRGAGMDGIQNMQQAQIVKKLHKGGVKNSKKHKKNYLLVRPLLSLSKEEITQTCIKTKIPFMNDPTNLDGSTSKRNYLRHTILPELTQLSGSKSALIFWKSRKQLYEFIDSHYKPEKLNFYKLSWSVYWWAYKSYYRLDLPKSLNEVKTLIKDLDITQQTSTQFLQIFYNFLTAWTQGFMKIKDTYFFVAHKFVYVISHTHDFWKEQIDESRKITKLWTYKTGDIDRKITDKKLIWSTLRFPKEGDKRKGKRLKKRLLNKKVPVFRRNFIPLLEKDWKIVEVFPIDKLSKGGR